MNVQIFGTKKSFDSKKAERYFKERGIKYQFVDMKEKGLSKGEFNSVCQAVGGYEKLMTLSVRIKTYWHWFNIFLRKIKKKKFWKIKRL